MPQESEAPASTPTDAPPRHLATLRKQQTLYRRITSSVPLLVTVIVHLILGGVAGVIVVQQNIEGKKKTFEAASIQENTAARQVEHRLQVARRGAASGGSSPVSANRIYSTAAGAVVMPEMPELPSMGQGGFGGFSGMGAGIGAGAGSGMATSLGSGTTLGGRGFMSLSFLGSTSQNVSKIVFVVDTSTEIMEPRKGGFQAFSIIREEIMRLVSRLPPTAHFNVILFSYNSGDENNNVATNLFSAELAPATSDNKKAFFAWMTPVNTQLGNFGPNSAGSIKPWRARTLPESAGLDPLFLPPVWSRATQAALEQKPDTIYVITATQGLARRRVDEATLAKRKVDKEQQQAAFEKELKKEGLDPKVVIAARSAAFAKAGKDLETLNRRLVSEKKDPIVIRSIHDIERADVQAAIRRAGANIKVDRAGWTNKEGKDIHPPHPRISTVENLQWNDFQSYYARLQRTLTTERPNLNMFLFVGPNEQPAAAIQDLTSISKRNGGTFQLLTTKRLEELRSREEAAAKP